MALAAAWHYMEQRMNENENWFADTRYADNFMFPEDLERRALAYLGEYFNYEQYDFAPSVFTVDEVPFVQIVVHRTDYRLPVIRGLQYCMYAHICCPEHIQAVNTYIQVVEFVLAHREHWRTEYLEYGFDFVLSSLYRLHIEMNRHLTELGMPIMN